MPHRPRSIMQQGPRLVTALSLLACTTAALGAQPLPAGWRQRDTVPQGAERSFERTGLPSGQRITLTEFPQQALEGKTPEAWLAIAVARAAAPDSGWIGAPVPLAGANGLATAQREFTATNGARGGVIFAVASGSPRLVRLFSVTFSTLDLARTPQGRASVSLLSALAAREIEEARSGTRRVPVAPKVIEASAPIVAPSPSSAAAPASADSTSPGAPIATMLASQIATVYYHWTQRVDAFQGLVMDDGAWLLLTDGTAYSALPVSLPVFDIARSRREEPLKWGRWRRRGDTYEFSWRNVAGGAFHSARGNPVATSAPDTRLQGKWVSGSSYTLPGGSVSMTFLPELTLTRDGRFIADGETRGTYRIDGYTIELRPQNGPVQRRAFFVDGDGIFVGGGRMHPAK